jgi:hypothetical protein
MVGGHAGFDEDIDGEINQGKDKYFDTLIAIV